MYEGNNRAVQELGLTEILHVGDEIVSEAFHCGTIRRAESVVNLPAVEALRSLAGDCPSWLVLSRDVEDVSALSLLRAAQNVNPDVLSVVYARSWRPEVMRSFLDLGVTACVTRRDLIDFGIPEVLFEIPMDTRFED